MQSALLSIRPPDPITGADLFLRAAAPHLSRTSLNTSRPPHLGGGGYCCAQLNFSIFGVPNFFLSLWEREVRRTG